MTTGRRDHNEGPLLDRLVGSKSAGSRRYLVFLIVIATAGWALASYDFNLLVTALPTIQASLHLSQTEVGLLAFLVYAAMRSSASSSATAWAASAESRCGSSRCGPPAPLCGWADRRD